MFAANSGRLLIAALCAAILVFLGISQFTQRNTPAVSQHQAVVPTQAQSAPLPAHAETTRAQSPDSKTGKPVTDAAESAPFSAIPAFRQWAEMAVASGKVHVNDDKGMKLAKARAISLRALIRKDPASALREALPAELRATLHPEIAAAIEQPVQKTGMCSVRLMCSHSPDASHGNCEATPILLEGIHTWNAHYGELQWQTYLGRDVGFEGIAVEDELAVQKITPAATGEHP